ncbi:MAG: GNAT family N-acetyltransferase [Balneolaceae bacterium]|nr:GNAT family N-acetyltransferase [Balneolaceae bacterium]
MSKDNFIDKPFEKLTPFELQSIFYLRQQVFIIEQKCFYSDIDQSDSVAHHLMYFDGTELKGYLRIFRPGVKFEDAVSIGRIVVAPAYRGGDTGGKLINKGIEVSKELFNCRTIKIEAQSALDGYYANFGFKSISEVYIVDDIPHKLMELTI